MAAIKTARQQDIAHVNQAMDTIRALVVPGQHQIFLQAFEEYELGPTLTDFLMDPRPEIVVQVTLMVGELVGKLGPAFKDAVAPLLIPLLKNCWHRKVLVRKVSQERFLMTIHLCRYKHLDLDKYKTLFKGIEAENRKYEWRERTTRSSAKSTSSKGSAVNFFASIITGSGSSFTSNSR